MTKLDKKAWNKFVAENSSPSSFLQSWQWGEFQHALGYEVERVEVRGEGDRLEAVAQGLIKPLAMGKHYLEVPKGPVMKLESRSSNLEARITDGLENIGRKNKTVLIRINPPYEPSKFQILDSKFVSPQLLLHQREPEDSVLVDTTKAEEELLAGMHEKSRYNIRLAERKGVVVEDKTNDAAAFGEFLKLIRQTEQRDKIKVWSDERFYKFRGHFLIREPEEGAPYAQLLTGSLKGEVLAAAIVMFFGDAATYLYAASSAENRPANTPSLVLWEAIRAAKAAGKHWYDMWGIAPQGAGEDHSWSGITRFKSRYVKVGETGKEIRGAGTWDLVLDKKIHSLLRIGKTVKKLIHK